MSGPASWFNNLSTCDFSFGPPPIHACSLSQETSHSSGTSNIGCLLQPRLHLTALASFRHYSLVHIAWLQWPLKIIVQSSMSTICILLLAEDLVWLPSITQIVDSVYFDMENLKNTSLGSCFYEGNLFNCIIISGSLFSNEFLFWWAKCVGLYPQGSWLGSWERGIALLSFLFPFSFLTESRTPAHGMVLHSGWVFLPLNPLEMSSHSYASLMSWMFLNSINVTIEINHFIDRTIHLYQITYYTLINMSYCFSMCLHHFGLP